MRPEVCTQYMQKVAVYLIIIGLIFLPHTQAAEENLNQTRETSGGHAIFLEHYTATWCQTCATIDPLVNEFVDNHNGRFYRVAFHPNDHDPFGSNVTTDRIGTKEIGHQLVYPTFWFDNEVELQGSLGTSMLENALRSAENQREDWIPVQMWWTSGQIDSHQIYLHIDDVLPMNSTITIFRLETLHMTTHIANNGLDTHHDVATQSIVFDTEIDRVEEFSLQDNEWNLSTGTLPGDENTDVFILNTTGDAESFVVVIETNGAVRSVIGISNEDLPRKTENGPVFVLILIGISLASATVLSRRSEFQ